MSEEINKNFKGLYDTSKTTFITDRTESTNFYEPEAKTPRIKNVSYSINFDKKELYKAIKDLQQKVEQLEKENEAILKNYGNLVKEWKQLENIRKEAIEYIDEHTFYYTDTPYDLLDILNKGGHNGK